MFDLPAIKSDDEDDQGASGIPEEGEVGAVADGSDDENMDEARKSGDGDG